MKKIIFIAVILLTNTCFAQTRYHLILLVSGDFNKISGKWDYKNETRVNNILTINAPTLTIDDAGKTVINFTKHLGSSTIDGTFTNKWEGIDERIQIPCAIKMEIQKEDPTHIYFYFKYGNSAVIWKADRIPID